MWFDLFKGILGMLVVVGAWLALQAFVRKRSACGADEDVLEHMAHGCAGCDGAGLCRNPQSRGREAALDKENHHELV